MAEEFRYTPPALQLIGLDKVDITAGGSPAAIDVTYDNATSGLTAINVQAAIDEIVALVEDPKTGIFWVSKDGDDTTGTGSISYPFLTIQAAYDASTSDALINVMSGDYTENLVFDGAGSTRVLIRGIGVEDQHRTKITGFHTFTNAATRISFEDVQLADNGVLGNIFDYTNSDGRHYYKAVTFNLSNAASRPFVTGNNTANWHIFHDCTFTNESDTSIGTVTGTPLFYFQECTGGYGIIQDQGCSVTAFGCVVAPYVDHRSGACTIYNCDTASRDGSDRFINSTAPNVAANRVALHNVNTWSNASDDYARINIPNCDWFINIVARDASLDNTNEVNRITKGISTADMDFFIDDDVFVAIGTGGAGFEYNTGTGDLEFTPPTGGLTSFLDYLRVSGTPSFINGAGVVDVNYTMNDINIGQPTTSALKLANTLTYQNQLTSIFGQMGGFQSTTTFVPSVAGAGTDTHSFRAGSFASSWNAAGSGRTASSISGVAAQCSVQGNNGTVTTGIALTAQAGLVLGNAGMTNCTSAQFNAPFKFFASGTIVNGTTLRTIGGTGATNNWNISAEGASTPNRFQGDISVGHLVAPNFAVDVDGDVRIRSTGALRFGGTTSSTFGQIASVSNGIFIMNGVGGTNNESLLFDMEGAANTIRMLTLSGASPQFNFDHFSFGASNFATEPNWVGQFSSPSARQPSVAGEYSDYQFTTSGNLELNSLAMSNVDTVKISPMSIDLDGGTITNYSLLHLSGNVPTSATNNYQLWQQGTNGLNLFNADTEFSNDLIHTGTNIGLYSATPVAQAANIGQLTDSTTGTANNTVVAISGSGDDANINDNFADLTAKINALEAALQAIGITA